MTSGNKLDGYVLPNHNAFTRLLRVANSVVQVAWMLLLLISGKKSWP